MGKTVVLNGKPGRFVAGLSWIRPPQLVTWREWLKIYEQN